MFKEVPTHHTTDETSAPLLSVDEIVVSEFQKYKKVGITTARMLTEKDYTERRGIIHTLEGESSFMIGDYLAVGVHGEEYPIRAATMHATKQQVGETDSDGWAKYETTSQVRASQIKYPFAVRRTETNDILRGKAGDYFVDTGKRQFIVDQVIFEQTYVRIEADRTTSPLLNFLATLHIISEHGHLS